MEAAATEPLKEGLAVEAAEEEKLFEHGEAREGIAAFVERRPPSFAAGRMNRA
jgi:enoyl-CoA hydratase